MAWLRIDDGIITHPKICQVGPEAAWLWITSLCYCRKYLTDGVFPAGVMNLSGLRGKAQKTAAKRLVDVGLWHEIDEKQSYVVHDFLEWNPSRADVESSQEWDRRRKDLYADKSLVIQIRKRDGDNCRYCGQVVRWSDRRGPGGGQFDHVIPRGPNTLENIVVACRSCNASKGGRTPEEAGMPLLQPANSGTSSDPDRRLSSLSRVSAGVAFSSVSINERKALSSSEESARETDDFAAFWAAYPRRVGKDAARKAFDRRRSDVTLEAVLAALELQKGSQQWQRDGGRYVPHPATWLNQGRWQDEVDTSGSGLSSDEWEQAAEIRRKSYGRCPHEQSCASYDECVTTIGLARRSGAA